MASDSKFFGIETRSADIEGELARVWREAAAADSAQDRGEGAARVRATLANVVLLQYGCDLPSRELDNLLAEVCLGFPSRFEIVRYFPEGLAAAGGGDRPLRTAVSSRCFLAQSGAHICSEEIYVDVAQNGVAHVHNLLLSVLVPDVPSIVVLLSDPLAGNNPDFLKLVESVTALADRVIYNSDLLADYSESLAVMLDDKESGFQGQEISAWADRGTVTASEESRFRDLAWRLNRRWRLLIAEQFDGGRAEMLSSLSNIQIDVRCGTDGMLTGAALLLAGWMANALSWEGTIESVSKTQVVFAGAASGRKCDLVFKLSPRSGTASSSHALAGEGQEAIASIRMSFENHSPQSQSPQGALLIERSATEPSATVTMELNGQAPACRTVSFGRGQVVNALIRELLTDSVDRERVCAGQNVRKMLQQIAEKT
jgi:glucose-6-phosphate dehydrogenase assembly protein OpcA